ncbi:LysM domain-containing membrane protein [Lachnospiraceae bacterium TWA4]|nr:LysM domain-containing membrane protein [Lachnospiraceae bacterium TWA4]
MDFKKSNLYMNRIKTKVVTQMTMDEDKNVLDSNEDMEQIVFDQATIHIEEQKVIQNQARINGKLKFQILYATKEDGKLEIMTGEIPFDECINIDGIKEGNQIQVHPDIEDLRTEIINSRKLNLKAIITFTVTVYEFVNRELILEAKDERFFDSLNRNLEALQTVVQKRDTYRIKEEIELPSSKPNMRNLLFKSAKLTGCSVKAMDGELDIKGNIQLFIVYSGEESHIPLQWFEKQIEFSGRLDVEDSTEEMIAWVDTSIQNQEISICIDEDGENRKIQLELTLLLEMILYEEVSLQVLDDVYSPNCEMNTEREAEIFERLHTRNSSRFKLSDRIKLTNGEKILQVCHCNGNIKIDETSVIEGGLQVEGVLEVCMLYICSDDKFPFRQKKQMIPFTQVLQAEGQIEKEKCVYQIRPEIEQLSAIMTDSEEIEAKVAISMDLLILEQKQENLLVGVTVAPLSEEKKEKMPGIVGYVVGSDDTLWSIAKRFYASVSLIKEINELASDELQEGQRLLIVKEGQEFM